MCPKYEILANVNFCLPFLSLSYVDICWRFSLCYDAALPIRCQYILKYVYKFVEYFQSFNSTLLPKPSH